ncbi:MAG: hypothetical protein AAGC70_09370 [Pseudomonadota bacterium]
MSIVSKDQTSQLTPEDIDRLVLKGRVVRSQAVRAMFANLFAGPANTERAQEIEPALSGVKA